MSQQWNPNLYDQSHQFVSQYGEGILAYLQPKKGERILDIGCGTGDLTQQIAQQGIEVIGIDSSAEMIKRAEEKFPSISFYKMDAKHIAFKQSFDAIFSNAVFHWIREKEQVIQQLHKVLKKGGRLVAEFGGKDNVGNLIATMKTVLAERGHTIRDSFHPWYFPSIGEYTSLLEQYQFRVLHAEHFDRWTPLNGEMGMRKWFLMFGDYFFQNISLAEQELIFEEVEERLRGEHYQDGVWYADYKRIRVVAVKLGAESQIS